VGCRSGAEERVTVAELLADGARAFPRREGLPDPVREARWLLAQALGRAEAWVWGHPDEPVPGEHERLFRTWLARRAAGEPAHYIVGTCPFWGRIFAVTPAVLIPRPETELIVECALTLRSAAHPRVLDVGTGSGCLAITLALELAASCAVGTDVCLDAVRVASRNARALGAEVRFAVGDLARHVHGGFDLVVANLPYVPLREISQLPIEIAGHEPRVALAAGEDGTALLTPFVAALPRVLAPGGHALLEVGPAQRAILEPTIAAAGLDEVHRGLDHAGIERVLALHRR
jgi:release factor glutamine methyltransferase